MESIIWHGSAINRCHVIFRNGLKVLSEHLDKLMVLLMEGIYILHQSPLSLMDMLIQLPTISIDQILEEVFI
jgi:hypothetical protein